MNPPEPATLVIFGATGDLVRRKLIPALHHLHQDGDLPEGTAAVGVGRRPLTYEAFRDAMEEAAREHGEGFDREAWRRFAARLFYLRADLSDPGAYHGLRDDLVRLDSDAGLPPNRIYDLAVPPSLVPRILAGLRTAGLDREAGGFVRLVLEKPFGHDLASARALGAMISQCFREDQVFRIDHYLGKDTVQNLIVLRFGNTILEPIWNRRYVDHVQITAAESIGIEGRGDFYEETGVVRDVIQNHAMQLLALVAMEPPSALDAESLRDEKARVLRAVPPVPPADAVRGQYGPGRVGGERAPGYREEEGVPPDSITPTFAALRLEIDTWRWSGVPFYVRAGKRLAATATEVAIRFQKPPLLLFGEMGQEIEPNLLAVNIQPEASIGLRLQARATRLEGGVQPVELRFRYAAGEGHSAYERLLLDVLVGDQTMFIRQDEVERAWAILEPVLEAWSGGSAPVYPAGSWGPREADQLLARRGHAWRTP